MKKTIKFLKRLLKIKSPSKPSPNASKPRDSWPQQRGLELTVSNWLVVKGRGLDLIDFSKEVGGFGITCKGIDDYNPLNFDSIIPIPQQELQKVWQQQSQRQLAVLRKTYWHIDSQAWGCRVVEENDHSITYCFSTVAEPPLYILEQLIRRYPNLKFNLSFSRKDRLGVLLGQRGRPLYWHKDKFGHEKRPPRY